MSSAVNKPVDVKQKEKDVNQKLQLYGIYSGMICRACAGTLDVAPWPPTHLKFEQLLTSATCSIRQWQSTFREFTRLTCSAILLVANSP